VSHKQVHQSSNPQEVYWGQDNTENQGSKKQKRVIPRSSL